MQVVLLQIQIILAVGPKVSSKTHCALMFVSILCYFYALDSNFCFLCKVEQLKGGGLVNVVLFADANATFKHPTTIVYGGVLLVRRTFSTKQLSANQQ